MKPAPVGAGAGAGAELVVNVPGTSIANHMAKRSLRGPIALLFLIAVATVTSCRNAVRRSLSIAGDEASGTDLLRILPSTAVVGAGAGVGAPPPWNATLARLAAVDPYEAEARKEVEDLLDVAGDGNGREFTHRFISSWRRWYHLERRKGASGTVEDGGGKRAVAGRIQQQGNLPALPEYRRALRDWSRKRWRLQPSVMSEMVSLVKDPVDKHHGGGNGQQRYASCAVVGNSGILLQREHGTLIDSHDFVIRLNNARIAGYAAHVGTRTGLSFVNSNILHLCARRRTCSCYPYGADVPMAMYICQPVHFLDYALCNGSSNPSSPSENRLILVTDPRFDQLCALIVKYYSLKRFVEETGKPPEEWAKAKDAKMFHYSSGMQAVLLAAGVCDKVSLFGFGKAEGAKHHYHTNQRRELDLHDYEAEYAFYRDLATAPHVIPFLAESAFKLPPLVVYN